MQFFFLFFSCAKREISERNNEWNAQVEEEEEEKQEQKEKIFLMEKRVDEVRNDEKLG